MSGTEHGAAVAVIGMAGRFPGAWNVEEFWRSLRQGVHSITFFGDEELAAAGVDAALLRDPRYVRAGGVLQGYDLFDPAFFGYSPREAELLDPQHRLFLETAWEALENAGHAPGTLPGAVGVYAGASTSGYLHRNMLSRPEVAGAAGAFQLELASRNDFLATRAAHRLNLRGPALTIQTGCSTGLVSVHVACQALLAGECDFAVAGGVAVKPGWGYMHSAGGIMSPDGHCRPFDARAGGTVGGSGVALVVLRRLDDALADGDTVHAVIRGSAVNNDGAQKAGFTAPSVDGQAAVIEEALAIADVDPATVGFVEAHGSGTELGDPVEVAALVQAFGGAGRPGSCALGSVKSNVGHLDTAAGAAGLIKAVLAVEHGEIPPTLHYREPNPRIDFAASPFFVNAAPVAWPGDGDLPRRAGVSSFGIGGTNAHVVLEQAPAVSPSSPARQWHLLPLSARTPAALEAATDRLAEHLRSHREQSLADVAWTLQAGRRAFDYRRVVVARDAVDAAAALATRAPDHCFDGAAPDGGRPVAFLFPGLGNHYPGMGRGLYDGEPVFRRTVDRCAEILRPRLGLDLREVLYPPDARDGEDGAAGGIDLRAMLGRTDDQPVEGSDPAQRLNQTRLAQVALFVTEYALARLWMDWGVRPEAMIGHSLGEYVAATVAGVWSLEDALMLVAERARLIHELPEGGMMGVTLPEAEVRPLLRDGLCIATLNGPAITVVSGPVHAVDALQAEMAARGVFWRRVNTRHAFHSTMMRAVAARLEALMRGVRLSAPSIPFVSNVTGTWIRPDEATDPAYWTRHLCGTVRFSEGAETLCADRRFVLLEVGPGQALRTLIRQLPCFDDGGPPSVASLRHAYERRPDVAGILGAAGRLWAEGVAVDWKAVHAHERLRRVPLPTYPFERRRCWIEPGSAASGRLDTDPLAKKPDPADWLYLPTWTRAPLPASLTMEPAQWLVLADGAGIGGRLAGRLEALGHTVAVVQAGNAFGRVGDLRYTARPGSADDLAALRDALHVAGIRPRRIIHLWGIDPAMDEDDANAFARAHARGHATVATLARTFARDRDAGPLRLMVITDGAQDVAGDDAVQPERAAVMGACLAFPREHPHATCRVVDVRLYASGAGRLVDQLLAEAIADAPEPLVALRGPLRWARGWHAVRPPERSALREGGAWLFSGALAAGGDVLAEHLARAPGTRIAFLLDPAFPRREEWDACLASPEGRGALGITIRGMRAAEAAGCRTLLLRADAGDAAAVGRAVDAVHEAFGLLHGVVHAVQLGASSQLAALVDAPSGDLPADLARVARELDAIDAAIANLPLELRLLQGSLFSVVGGPGLAGATAACVLVDAWAQARAARGGAPWTSVSWDRWHLDDGDGGADRAILRDEGARAFDRVVALAGEPRAVVSTCDLSARIAQLAAPPRVASPAHDEGSSSDAAPRPGRVSHPPTNEAEELLAGIWRDLLGIAEIGIHDDFFELGGHSLLGMQVLSRIRELFRVELPLRAVFEGPTIAGLAELVDQAILLKLEEMTEEEAESALAGLSRPAGFGSLVGG